MNDLEKEFPTLFGDMKKLGINMGDFVEMCQAVEEKLEGGADR